MTGFRPLYVERTGDFVLPLGLDDAFLSFTPEGERAWVKGWEPEYLHPGRPARRAGTVFRTRHGDEETLWLVLECDPSAGVNTYARFTPGSRLGTVRVRCRAVDRAHTRVTVTYALTALSPAGNDVLAALTPTAYDTMLEAWRDAIPRSRSGSGTEDAG